MGDYYNFDFDGKKSIWQSIDIKAYRPDGDDYDTAYGYFKKASPIGKSLMKLLKDGNDHLVYARFVPVANKDDDSVIVMEYKAIKDVAEQ